MFFDFPADRLSVGERTSLSLARRATGEAVPTETLCYVWDNKEAKGNAFDNAFTKRIRMVVLESGAAAKPGGWTQRAPQPAGRLQAAPSATRPATPCRT